jgi:hypothetical protein
MPFAKLNDLVDLSDAKIRSFLSSERLQNYRSLELLEKDAVNYEKPNAIATVIKSGEIVFDGNFYLLFKDDAGKNELIELVRKAELSPIVRRE